MASEARFPPTSTFVRRLFHVTSPSWFYPLKGIWFFTTHPYLWPLLRGRMLPCILLSAFVLTNLFLWTYLPQVAILAIFHHQGAWFNGTILILGEGAAIVAILFEAFFVDETQVDVFDAVLVKRGCEDLVLKSRPVAEEGSNPVARLGKPRRSAIYGPFSVRQIVEFILLLPLNLIPIVGVPLFLVLTGYRAGPLQHWRYFELKGMDKKRRKAFVRRRKWQYAWFGTMALVLQLVPVLSMFFLITTAAGSALWAAKIEEETRIEEARAFPQPAYTDTDDPV